MRSDGGATDHVAAYYSFDREVVEEIASEEAILKHLKEPPRGENLGHALALVLTTIMIVLIFEQNDVFFLWLIVALVLYSYNFLILLIPTTTQRIRPDEREAVKNIERERKWLAIKLLAKKRRLAVEIGLTVFLGGMVPLALSFAIIFGLGLIFAVYLGFMTQSLTDHVVWTVIIQIVFILLFYLMVLLVEPQAQGITRLARTLKSKLGLARTRGKSAIVILMMLMVTMVLVASILALGAVLLPGLTLGELLAALSALSQNDLLILLFVIVSQLVLMRHFQGVASRHMAISLVTSRLDHLRNDVLVPLESIGTLPHGEEDAQLDLVKRMFYSIVIYDVIEHNIFGRSPIYLVGPRLRYVLNDEVLARLS